MASRIQALKEAMDQKTTAAPVREKAVPQQVSSEVSPPVKQEVVASGPLVEGDEWSQVVGSLKLIPMIREFANNCFFEQKEGAVIQLSLSKRHETYRSDSNEQRLKQALSEHYGEDITLQFSVQNEVQNTPAQQAIRRAEQAQLEAEAAIENDAVVSGLKEMFGATVIPGSVKPL